MSRRIEVERHVAADPASVALLLAGLQDGGLIVAPPRRNGIGFLAEISTTDSKGRPVPGELRIEPAEDPGCDVRLILTTTDPAGAAVVRRVASRFLSTLAVKARERAFAA